MKYTQQCIESLNNYLIGCSQWSFLNGGTRDEFCFLSICLYFNNFL